MERYFRSIAFIFAVLPQIVLAGGGASPFPDATVGVIINKDGTTTDCAKKASRANSRSETVARQFTQLTVDPCFWSTSVNQKDLTVPATIYRAGADISCTIEEALLPAPANFADDQFARFLEGRGFTDVKLESSGVSKIGGKEFKEQALVTRMPVAFDASRPLYRVFFWLWSDSTRLSTLQCLGPASVALREKAEIVSVSNSLRIK
jgi:hypothetical protein